MVAVARVRAVEVVVGGRLWRWSLWRGLVVWLRRWLRVCFGARACPGAGALQFWKQGQCFVSMLFRWHAPTGAGMARSNLHVVFTVAPSDPTHQLLGGGASKI